MGGIIWGSFLNVVAYRSIHGMSVIVPRSHCPKCNHILAWYDLVPVFSWLLLRGSCRYCHATISPLYPFIELLTALLALLLYYADIDPFFYASYFCFFSALIISIRTDLEYMLISRFFSLYMIPVGIILSAYHALPISPIESFFGASFGYAVLYITAFIFRCITHKDGLGEGDSELLAMIGSFTGIIGAWFALSAGSIIGSLIIAVYLFITKKGPNTKTPFGPFLVLGAILYVLYYQSILTLCMY